MTEFSDFMHDAILANCWTSDMPLLESQEYWYLFLFPFYRRKYADYIVNGEPKGLFLGNGWTKSPIYNILNVSDGSKEKDILDLSGKHRVLGEVWKVPTYVITNLDYEEHNLLESQRISVPIILRDKGVLQAWTYIINRDYLLKGGIKVKTTGIKSNYRGHEYLEAPRGQDE